MIDITKIQTAECPDSIEKILTEELKENTTITDDGIGYYEYGSIKGFDSHIGLSTETDDVLIDITGYEMLDNLPITKENLEDDIGKFNITISISKGGDPDACAESGRRRCGSCNACSEIGGEFEATLTEIKEIEGKKIAVYNVKK